MRRRQRRRRIVRIKAAPGPHQDIEHGKFALQVKREMLSRFATTVAR